MKKYRFMQVFSLALASFSLEARVLELHSRLRLFSRINESYLAVVQFCYCDQKSKSSCNNNRYRPIKESLQAVSNNSKFRQADIDFIVMNCNGNRSIAQEFGINSFPVLMLFVNGLPLQNAYLTGYAHECTINAFIEDNLVAEIDNVLHYKRKEQKRKEEAQYAALAAWGPYWYNGCGWGYGYGGCRPCGWGLYGGWNCGRCW